MIKKMSQQTAHEINFWSESAYRIWADTIATNEYISSDLFYKCELMMDQEEVGEAMDFWFNHDPDQALEFWETELLETAWKITGWI